jgi:hypothetical protein
VTMIADFRFFPDLEIGHPDSVTVLLSDFAKVQQILSRNVIIIAVAHPICTGVQKIRESELRTSSLISSISSCIEHVDEQQKDFLFEFFFYFCLLSTAGFSRLFILISQLL